MLDIMSLDESIKIKAVGRILNTEHPFLKLIAERLNLDEFFNPKLNVNVEGIALQGINLLKGDRKALWLDKNNFNNIQLLKVVRESSCKEIMTTMGLRSIPFFMIWHRGVRKIKHLTVNDLDRLRPSIDRDKYSLARKAIGFQLDNQTNLSSQSYVVGSKMKQLKSLTSKEIRLARLKYEPACSFKIGLHLTENESLSWSLKLSKVKSTKHKNILLRVAHGDIYTNEKLFRFGMSPDPTCPRCQEIDTLQHKFIECDYARRIWAETFRYTRTIITTNPTNEDPIEAALGAHKDSNVATVTLNAEILLRISCLKPENYLVHPKFIVKSAIATVLKNEKDGEVKDMIKSIWSMVN